MITRVYIWPTGLKNKDKVKKSSSIDPFNLGWYWGHVAIEIPDPEEDNPHMPLHYWSYWPPSMKPSKQGIYYPDDHTSCGDAKIIIDIENLHINKMEKTWEKELKKDFHDYNHNCCTVTAELLRAGFAGSYFDSFGTFTKRSWRIVTSPFSTFLFSTKTLASEALVWSPFVVEDFANFIKKISK